MNTNGKVRVEVRSREVPVRTIELPKHIGTSSGYFFSYPGGHAVVYESVLDDSQQRAIDEAKRLSHELGLQLEIVDAAKSNPLRRTLSALISLGRSQPSLTLTTSWSDSERRPVRGPPSPLRLRTSTPLASDCNPGQTV